MFLISFFTVVLILGMGVSQGFDISPWRDHISTATIVCLAYIMVEVGLEFAIDKKKWRSYLYDFGIAMTAAVFPALLCMLYFIFTFQLSVKESTLIGMSTAPTSAGILFSMLIAAGLGASWVFHKARNLAIFDDLGTILLMIPLKMWMIGFHVELLWAIFILIFLAIAAVRFQNQLKLPFAKGWLLGYAVLLTVATVIIERTTNIHLEILFPAFILGSMIHNPWHVSDDKQEAENEYHGHAQESKVEIFVDRTIKGTFMFLVGCSLPKITIGDLSWFEVSKHVLILMFLSNVGKCFPLIAYRKIVPWKERLALSIAMFPRGEVGAGVLLIALSYGIGGMAVAIAVLTLALNLLCTGIFIYLIMKLLDMQKKVVNPAKIS